MPYPELTEGPKASSAWVINPAFESAHAQIQREIKKRELEAWYHIVLDEPQLNGISYLWNYQTRKDLNLEYYYTKNISTDLLDVLLQFKITTEKPKMANIFGLRKEDGIIWPPRSANFTFADFTPIDIKIVIKGGLKFFMWTLHIWSVERSRDVSYSILSFPKGTLELAENFLTLIDHLVIEVNRQNNIIRVHGGENIPLRSNMTWDDLILPERILKLTKHDIEYWMVSEDRYRKMNVPYRRGYLFEGPPGNGKTAVARTIITSYPFTAFSFDFSDWQLGDAALQNAFSSAAEAAPSIFLLEDIDRVFGLEKRTSVTLEGLFNCLDGIAVYNGVVVIATANHPEKLDDAIRLRPGRFDVPVRFDNPDITQRKNYLRFALKRCEENRVSSLAIDCIAARTEGMSMSFMKLIFESAGMNAEQYIEDDNLYDAYERAKQYYQHMETNTDRRAGFAVDKDTDCNEENRRKARRIIRGNDEVKKRSRVGIRPTQ